MKMDIYKIGGIVFRTPQGFESLKEVLNNQNQNTFIVVSAIGKTSRNLRSCINFAAAGKFEESIDMVDSIIDLHESLADSILSEINRKAYDSFLNNRKNLLAEKLKGLSLIKDISPSISDYILAEGENLALQLIYLFIEEHFSSITKLSSEQHIVTNNNYGKAIPQREICIDLIQNSIKIFPTKFYMMQGFSGISLEKKLSTMGFESSNLTACIVAAAADAKELVIWSDVDGIFGIDPKFAPSRQLDHLSLEDAKKLALEGLKLIYLPMIEYSKEYGFDIRIKNIYNPNAQGTLISYDVKTDDFPVIVMKEDGATDLELSINFIDYTKALFLLSQLTNKQVFTSEYRYMDKKLQLRFDNSTISNVALLKEIGSILY